MGHLSVTAHDYLLTHGEKKGGERETERTRERDRERGRDGGRVKEMGRRGREKVGGGREGRGDREWEGELQGRGWRVSRGWKRALGEGDGERESVPFFFFYSFHEDWLRPCHHLHRENLWQVSSPCSYLMDGEHPSLFGAEWKWSDHSLKHLWALKKTSIAHEELSLACWNIQSH